MLAPEIVDPVFEIDVELEAVGGSAATAEGGGRFGVVSRVLRAVGALIILAAAGAFLIQSWSRGDDLVRYSGLVVLTTVLGAAGFAAGALRESKGARTLFLVMLAMLPVHAAILGGLIYSQMSWDGSVTGALPSFGVWVAPSAAVALAVAGGMLALLVPLLLGAARSLVPGHARVAAAALLASHAVLLVPVRDSMAVSGLLALSAAAWLAIESRWLSASSRWRTFEGRVVRSLMALPTLLLCARSYLHGFAPDGLAGVALLSLGAAFFLAARRTGESNAFLVSSALVCFGVGWSSLAFSIFSRPSPIELALPVAGLLLVLSRWSRGGAFYRHGAACLAVGGSAVELLFDPSIGASALALVLGITTLALGVHLHQKLVALVGVLGAGFGLLYQVAFAIERFSWNRWGALAVIGLATIATAIVLERYQTEVVAWSRRFAGRVREWSL